MIRERERHFEALHVQQRIACSTVFTPWDRTYAQTTGCSPPAPTHLIEICNKGPPNGTAMHMVSWGRATAAHGLLLRGVCMCVPSSCPATSEHPQGSISTREYEHVKDTHIALIILNVYLSYYMFVQLHASFLHVTCKANM